MNTVFRVIDLGDDPIPHLSTKYLFLFNFFVADMKCLAKNLSYILRYVSKTERFASWHYSVWLQKCLADAYQLKGAIDFLPESDAASEFDQCEEAKGLYEACQKLLKMMVTSPNETNTFLADYFRDADHADCETLVSDVNVVIAELFRTAKRAKEARKRIGGSPNTAEFKRADNESHSVYEAYAESSSLYRDEADAVLAQHRLIWKIFWRFYYFLAFSETTRDGNKFSIATTWEQIPQLLRGILRRPPVELFNLFAHVRTSTFCSRFNDRDVQQRDKEDFDLNSSVLNISTDSVPLVFWLSTAIELFRTQLKRVRQYAASCAETAAVISRDDRTCLGKLQRCVGAEVPNSAKKRCHFASQREIGSTLDAARKHGDVRNRRVRARSEIVSKFEAFLRSLRSHNFDKFRDLFFENVSMNNCIFLEYANNVTSLGLEFPKVAVISLTPSPAASASSQTLRFNATSHPVSVTLDYKRTEIAINNNADSAILLFRFLFVICRSWADTFLRSSQYVDRTTQRDHTRKTRDSLELVTRDAQFLIEGLVSQCETAVDTCGVGVFPVAIALQIISALEPELRLVLLGIADIINEKTKYARLLDEKVKAATNRESKAPTSSKLSR